MNGENVTVVNGTDGKYLRTESNELISGSSNLQDQTQEDIDASKLLEPEISSLLSVQVIY